MYQALRELIDRLVDQFSDPYAFLRELVQNSLDAGSAQLEFDLEHLPQAYFTGFPKRDQSLDQ